MRWAVSPQESRPVRLDRPDACPHWSHRLLATAGGFGPLASAPMRRLIASTLGLGFIPRRLWGSDSGAGTFGSAFAAAIGVGLLVLEAPWWIALVIAMAFTALSLWAAVPFTRDGEDPGWVCIDEAAGTMLALVGLGGIPWVVALVVARLADIFKVLPGVKAAERLPGSIGVTADDLVAGLYGLGVGWALIAVL